MDSFIINKQTFYIYQIIGDYAIIISKLTSEKTIYKIKGCQQYDRQLETNNVNNLHIT